MKTNQESSFLRSFSVKYREEIRQIALLLQAEQVALTQRHIGRYLAQPAILRDPGVRRQLREVCHKVKTEIRAKEEEVYDPSSH